RMARAQLPKKRIEFRNSGNSFEIQARETCMLNPFAPPVFASEEETQRARILHLVIGATMLISVGVSMLVMVQQPAAASRALATSVFIPVLGLVLLQLNRLGRTRLAGILFTGGLILLITGQAITAGGVRSPGVTMYFIIVLMTGLLLGEREGAVAALSCAAL